MGYINPEAVPPIEYSILGRSALGCINKFFEDPENQKDFERWKEDQESAKKKNAAEV